MMQTANYQLPQWEAGDAVKRGDFNDAMSRLDTALAAVAAGKLRLIKGVYKGRGDYGETRWSGIIHKFTPFLPSFRTKSIRIYRLNVLSTAWSKPTAGRFAFFGTRNASAGTPPSAPSINSMHPAAATPTLSLALTNKRKKGASLSEAPFRVRS